MEFSRNKFTRWLLAFAGFFLVVLSALYIYSAKFSADSFDESDTGFLADIQEKPNFSDPTLIRLPEKYSKTEIETALTNQATSRSKTTTKLSAKDREISEFIHSQESKIARDLPLKTGTQENPAMSDLVFRVADYKGNTLTPSTKNDKTAIKSVPDNFEFGSISESLKNEMIGYYPVIELIYGPRQTTDKIKVIVESGLDRAYFSSATNTIVLGNGTDGKVALHEMVHAFHGYRCVPSLWEEGAAVKVSAIVQEKMGLFPDDMMIQSGYRLNYLNLPSTYEQVWDNAWSSMLPYAYGSMLLDKIYMEDSNFFKKFNQKLYVSVGNIQSQAKLNRIAIESIERIEGEESWSWFSHQYPYIEIDLDDFYGARHYHSPIASTVNRGYWAQEDIGVGSAPKGGEGPSGQESFIFTIKTNYSLEESDFNVRLLGESGQLLVDRDKFTTHQKWGNNVNKIYLNPSSEYIQYQGLVNIEITPTDRPENQKIITFLKTEERSDDKDVFVYNKTGTIAVFSKIDGSVTKVVEKTNGYFSAKADWLESAGKFRVEIYNKKAKCNSSDLSLCLAAKVNGRYFNKTDITGLYLDLGVANTCGLAIESVKPLNRSFTINLSTKKDCGQVFSLNRIPLKRYWGRAEEFTKSDLPKNKLFRYQITYASDSSKIARRIGRVRTLDQADFTLLETKDFGNVSDGSFYRQYTFNQAYDPQSISIEISQDVGMPGDLPSIATSVERVDDQTFKLIPTGKLHNNASYIARGLYDVKDTFGNPLYKFNWDLAYIETPVNPANTPVSEYQLNFHSGTIEISTNFRSDELADKLTEIKLFRLVSDDEFCIDGCPEYMEFNAAAVNQPDGLTQKITIDPKVSLSSGNTYYVSMPLVLDNNNNLVSNRLKYFIAE